MIYMILSTIFFTFLGIHEAYSFSFNRNLIKISKSQSDLFEIDEKKVLAGIDQRNITEEEVSVEQLLYYHHRHALYMRIKSDKIGILEKENLARNYLNQNSSMINILEGGLLDDWDFTF